MYFKCKWAKLPCQLQSSPTLRYLTTFKEVLLMEIDSVKPIVSSKNNESLINFIHLQRNFSNKNPEILKLMRI